MVATPHEQALKHPLKSFHSIGLTASKPSNNPSTLVRLPKTPGLVRPIPDSVSSMKQIELARELAREAKMPPAAAQDHIDELVHRIVKNLHRGRPVELPGLGKLVAPAGGRKKP